MYNDRLNETRKQGLARIESRQFAQGRTGQIGSKTGEEVLMLYKMLTQKY